MVLAALPSIGLEGRTKVSGGGHGSKLKLMMIFKLLFSAALKGVWLSSMVASPYITVSVKW